MQTKGELLLLQTFLEIAEIVYANDTTTSKKGENANHQEEQVKSIELLSSTKRCLHQGLHNHSQEAKLSYEKSSESKAYQR